MTIEIAAASAATTAAMTSPTDGLWAPQRRRLTVGLVLTVTLVAFESLALSTVMPLVSRDLGGLHLYGWVFAGFFLGSLVGIVVAGQEADRRGTMAPYGLGLTLFAGGLLIGGLAPSMALLVVGRVVQGCGAGAIPAVAYTSVGRVIPAPLRPRMFAIFASAWVIPGLLGPAAASAIAAALGWRAVFLALLPLVALAAVMTAPALDRHPPVQADGAAPPADRRPLALALVIGVALVLIAVAEPRLLLAALELAVGAPIAVAAFLRLVPPGTVRLAPGMPAAVMTRGLLTFAFFGVDAYVSLAFVEVRGQPAWVSGVALTAAALWWTTGAWIQQRALSSVGPRALVIAGFSCVAVGVAGMLGAIDRLPLWPAVAVWSIAGLGMGLAYASISVTVLGLAAPGQEGNASASLQLTDVLGVVLGTGAGGAFIAIGSARGWPPASSLQLAFAVMLAMAVFGIAAARRLPRWLPHG
ncbi:MAG: MFS transporter [Candidatus Binatia bacterium]